MYTVEFRLRDGKNLWKMVSEDLISILEDTAEAFERFRERYYAFEIIFNGKVFSSFSEETILQ